MKHMMKFALVLIIALGMVSCDMFNVDVESTVSGALDIAVEEGVAKGALGVYPFSAYTTMPMDNPDVQKYKDNIVNVGVDGIFAKVVSVKMDGKPIDGVAFLAGSTFTMSNGVDPDAVLPLKEDWNIVPNATVSVDDLNGNYIKLPPSFKT